MKQNEVVCQPEPALLFFIFRFKNLISGPKRYRGFRETGPRPVLEKFTWSNRNIMGPISSHQHQFVPTSSFLASILVLCGYANLSHNFTNLIFLTSSLLFITVFCKVNSQKGISTTLFSISFPFKAPISCSKSYILQLFLVH